MAKDKEYQYFTGDQRCYKYQEGDERLSIQHQEWQDAKGRHGPGNTIRRRIIDEDTNMDGLKYSLDPTWQKQADRLYMKLEEAGLKVDTMPRLVLCGWLIQLNHTASLYSYKDRERMDKINKLKKELKELEDEECS